MSTLSLLRQAVPASVSMTMGRTALHISKHSPGLLLGVGIAGFVATTIQTSRATLKVEGILEKTKSDVHMAKSLHEDESLQVELNAEYSKEDYTKDLTQIYVRSALQLGRIYGPSILLGVGSIYCLTKSYNILATRNAALMTAYSVLAKSYDRYRVRIKEELGDDAEFDIYHDAQYRRIASEDGTEGEELVREVGPNYHSPYAKFFDDTSSAWCRTPEYNYLFLRSQQNYANDKLRSRGHLFLNDVYEMLGLGPTRQGTICGWVISDSNNNSDNYVDFGFLPEDGANPRARDFVNGHEGSVLLDFNVDGVIMDKINWRG